MIKRRTIVVYGASSNIGREFINKASKKGIAVIATTRNINSIPISMGVEVVKADITKIKDVEKVLKDRKIYATINFAVDFSADYSKAEAVNVFGEQHILDASIKHGVKRHIYISTIATQMLKSNPYRDTKLQAEEIVRTKGKGKIDWVILRYAHVLGTPTWDKPFKIILPYLRLGIPQVPTDAKEAAFPYVTIDTVIEATLAAIESPPNQTITIFDGKITLGEYLSTMEKIYNINVSFLPIKLFQLLDSLFGKYFPLIRRYYAMVQFLAHPPTFENDTMKRELKIKTRNFREWITTYFSKNIKRPTDDKYI